MTLHAGPAHEPFLAAIHANLDDDAARLVYADWLLERGDPRGQLIVLQAQRSRAGGLSAEAEREEKRLLAAHARAWLGPLAPLVPKSKMHFTRFTRGFVSELYVEPRAKSAEVARERTARTLEAVRGDVTPFVVAELPLLRRISGLDFLVLQRLCALPIETRITRIECNTGWVTPMQSEFFAKQEARAFAHLVELDCAMDPRGAIDEPTVAWLLHSWVVERVRRLRLAWATPAPESSSVAGRPSDGILRAFMTTFEKHPNLERIELCTDTLCDPILRRDGARLELSLRPDATTDQSELARALLARVSASGWTCFLRDSG